MSFFDSTSDSATNTKRRPRSHDPRRARATSALLASALFMAAGGAFAQAVELPVQGFLTETDGSPSSGRETLSVAIVDDPSAGSVLYGEDVDVEITNGFFTTYLGRPGGLDASVFRGGDRYLSITVDGTELLPRTQLTPAPYALIAENVVGDIEPASVSVGGSVVIDDTGQWVGDVAGLQGPQGAVGPVGPQGPAGLQGPQGDRGLPGAPGIQGPQGPVGPTGPAGPGGATGPQGPAGPAGAEGAQGPAGPAGEQGPEGPQGPQGVAGAIGPEGPQGLQGPQGERGLPGADGAQGPAGPQGPEGPQGPQGVAGPEGPTGPEGPEGPQGLRGPQGPQGSPGLDGRDGQDGSSGLLSMNFVAGRGNTPGIDQAAFVSPAATVRLRVGEAVHFTATAALGTEFDFADRLSLFPCFQVIGGSNLPIQMGAGVQSVQIMGPMLSTYTLSAVLSDIAGDVLVGMCGVVPRDPQNFYPWNRIANGYVSTIVGNVP